MSHRIAALLVALVAPHGVTLRVSGQTGTAPSSPASYWSVLEQGPAPDSLNAVMGVDLIATALRGNQRTDTSRVLGPLLRQARRDRGEAAAWAFFAAATLRARVGGPCAPVTAMAMRAYLFGCRQVFEELRDAIRMDSAFAPALMALDAAVPYPLIWDNPTRILGFVTAALQREVPDSVRRRLARLQALLSAEVISDTAIARRAIERSRSSLAGGESRYLLAQASAGGGDVHGVMSHYAAAAGSDDPGEALHWIARDIGLIGEPADLMEWQGLQQAGPRGEWMTRFWSERDRRNGQVNGHRLLEHFRRWRTALTSYRSFLGEEITRIPPAQVLSMLSPCMQDGVIDPESFVEPVAFATSDGERFPVLDDRGAVWMRHGPPTRRANYPGVDHDRFEGWLYATTDGPLVAFFCRPRESLNRSYAVGFAKGSEMMPYCEVMAAYCVVEARRSLGNFPPEQHERLRQRGVAALNALLSFDSDSRSFKQELAANIQIFGRGLSRRGALLAVDFEVQAVRQLLERDSTAQVRWEVLGWDAAGNQVLNFDAVNGLPALSPGQRDGFATVVLDLPVESTLTEVLVVLSDPRGERGTAFRRRNIPTGASLLATDLSDLLLFAPSSTGGRSREWGDTTISLSPTLSSGRGKRLTLGYSISGFRGVELRTTVAVREIALSTASPLVSIASTRTPDDDRVDVIQDVDLSRLDSDDYEIILTVAAPDGRTFERRQRIRVR